MDEQGRQDPIKGLVELNKLVHEPRRFGILNALAKAGDLGLGYLRLITGLSQGNLAAHLRKLEEADLIEVRRRTILRRPYSRVYITEAGREALRAHWRRLKDLEKEIEKWQPSVEEDKGNLTDEDVAVLFRSERTEERTTDD